MRNESTRNPVEKILILTSLMISSFGYLIESPILTISLSIISYAFLLRMSLREYGIPDYQNILLISSGLYAFVGPFDVIFLGHDEAFSPFPMAQSAFWATVFVVTFGLTRSLLKRPGASTPAPATQKSNSLLLSSVTAVMAAYLYFSYQDLVRLGGASRADILSLTSLTTNLLAFATFTGLIVLISAKRVDLSVLLLKGYWQDRTFYRNISRNDISITAPILIVLMIIILLLVNVIFLGSRREILSFLLAVFTVLGISRIPWWGFLLGAAIISISAVLPWLREAEVRDWVDIISNFSFYFGSVKLSDSEFMSFSVIGHHFFSTHVFGSAPTYLDAFGTLVPQSIWPNRPEPVAQWFVATYFPEIYQAGGGLAFNAVVESIMNFGYLGPVVSGIIFSLVFYLISKWKHQLRIGPAVVVLFASFFMRQDLATTIKGGIIIIVFTAAWIGILSISSGNLNRMNDGGRHHA